MMRKFKYLLFHKNMWILILIKKHTKTARKDSERKARKRDYQQ